MTSSVTRPPAEGRSNVATPRRAFVAAMLLTLMVVTLGMWTAWSLRVEFGRLAKTELRLERLVGTITGLDEVLTMSARMSVLTSEAGWEKRYKSYEPELDAALKETNAIAPDEQIVAALHQTEVANTSLVDIEHKVFDWVRDGRAKEAGALLDSPAYATNKAAYAQGISKAVGLIHKRVDSEVRAHSDRASIILVADGIAGIALVLGWLAVLRLVQKNSTERAALVRDLEEAVRARNDFLALASHELRTPLNALSLSVDSIVHPGEADLALSTAASLKFTTVERQVRRLSASIDALLDVSRITSGRLYMELEDNLDFAAVARETIHRFKVQAVSADCDVKLTGGDEPIYGRWDKMRLEQVVGNLLSNALKYGVGKPIDMHLSATDDVAELTVRDHGIGISPDKQVAIFARFERAVSQREYRGVGLGLWIVREVVSAMDGTVTLDSRPGEGSTFRVKLPRHAK